MTTKESRKDKSEKMNWYAKICDVEDLCFAFHHSLVESDEVQNRLERVLEYLQEQNVIDGYNVNLLDWIFSNEQCY